MSIVDHDGLHLSSDEISAPGIRVSRTWHTPIEAEVAPSAASASLVLPIEGAFGVAFADIDFRVAPGDLLVVAGRDEWHLSATVPTARIEVESSLLPPLADSVRPGVVVRAMPPDYRTAFVSLVNATLNSPITPHHVGFPAFQLSVGYLASAVLAHALAHDPPADSPAVRREDALYEQAVALIARRAADPAFSVTALAEALDISDRYLRMIFARRESSPLRELRKARVVLASGYLRARSGGTALSTGKIAELSGFANAQAMRRAFAAVDE